MKNTKHPNDYDAVFEAEDYLYFYEEHITPEASEKQVDFLIEYLELEKSMKILDLACGYGRHTNRLVQRGYEVIGLDKSEAFLQEARKRAKKFGVNPKYIQGDMRELDYQQEFDRIILMFTAFGYFSDEENFKVLQNINSALTPGGILCFDIMNRDYLQKNFLPYIVSEKNGDLMIDRNSFDSKTGHLHNRRIIIRDGIRKDKPFLLRVYNPTEIKMWLKKAGYIFKNMYSYWEGDDLQQDSRRMILIAKKEKV
ncbi:MAG: class I SAM-dependent methyltransferase [Candidatus Cloacimonetes bacterium]|nr:class I SAM-dependent methyltransferase [Candidatus Cloacimonadota bacterium]